MSDDTNPNPLQSRYHYLLLGKVVFLEPGNEDAQAIDLNALFLTDTEVLNAGHLAQMHQVLQYQFMQQEENAETQVVNVIILNWMKMGLQSKAEFQSKRSDEDVPVIVDEIDLTDSPS